MALRFYLISFFILIFTLIFIQAIAIEPSVVSRNAAFLYNDSGIDYDDFAQHDMLIITGRNILYRTPWEYAVDSLRARNPDIKIYAHMGMWLVADEICTGEWGGGGEWDSAKVENLCPHIVVDGGDTLVYNGNWVLDVSKSDVRVAIAHHMAHFWRESTNGGEDGIDGIFFDYFANPNHPAPPDSQYQRQIMWAVHDSFPAYFEFIGNGMGARQWSSIYEGGAIDGICIEDAGEWWYGAEQVDNLLDPEYETNLWNISNRAEFVIVDHSDLCNWYPHIMAQMIDNGYGSMGRTAYDLADYPTMPACKCRAYRKGDIIIRPYPGGARIINLTDGTWPDPFDWE